MIAKAKQKLAHIKICKMNTNRRASIAVKMNDIEIKSS